MAEKGVMLSLEDRVAVVTGGSRGIGAAIVQLFTRAGARVVFSYQRAATEAEKLAAECGRPERCVAVKANLDSSEAAKSLVDTAVQRFGRVDILVGNHGVWPPQDVPIDQMSDQQWRSTQSINVDSLFG